MNGRLIGGGVCLVLSLASQAVDHLELAFNGVIMVAECQFDQEGSSKEVHLPSQNLRFFERNSRTQTTSFTLGLKNCSPAILGKMVKLTFNSTQTQQVNGVAMLATTGDTGLVIGLEDALGQAIILGREVKAGTISQIGSGSINQFQFGAYALAPGAVKAGNYSATVTFEASYQ
ncbi:type 1 fimbrial protein [Serratia fonticola]|uniref:fimbrial protein n=1 Tax=Serratia fonticola TaxID=47917 RepID=UPI0015C5F237|nr:fimbrial protein [Serratia fonticola]MBC3377665.1 type 1 fimbrial protein [Serratia fonticola]NYA36865.1 type 1 fimbrial protein [Serratia fonticola]